MGVLDLSEKNAEAVAAEIRDTGGRAASIAADVANYSALDAACQLPQQMLDGPFDLLVNKCRHSPDHR